MKRATIIVVRTLFGVALLIGVIIWLEPGRILDALADFRTGPLLGAVGTQVIAKLLWSYRWQEILRANQMHRGFWDLFAVVHIGLFFNTFLPSGVGGDLVRGYYASRGRERLVSSYLTLLIERILGMGTLAGLAALASTIALASGATPVPRSLLVSVAVLATAIFGAVVLTFSWSRWIGLLERLRVPERWLEDLAHSLDLFSRPETPRFAILASSLALKLIGVFFYILCGRAVGLELAPLVYFLVTPIAELVGMLPVTLNGLGVREGALVALFGACGAPPAVAGAVALLGLVIYNGFALLGGVVYTFYRHAETPGPEI